MRHCQNKLQTGTSHGVRTPIFHVSEPMKTVGEEYMWLTATDEEGSTAWKLILADKRVKCPAGDSLSGV